MPGNGILGLKLELGKSSMLAGGAPQLEKAGPPNPKRGGAKSAGPSGTANHATTTGDRMGFKGMDDASLDLLENSQPVSEDPMLGEAGQGKDGGPLGLLIDAVMGDDDGMDPELTMSLQGALKDALGKRAKRNTERKAKILDDAFKNVEKQADELRAEVAKEARDVRTSATAQLNGLRKKMEAKAKEMEDRFQKYSTDAEALWKEYQALYQQSESTKVKVSLAAEKRCNALKRKVGALAERSSALLQDVDSKLQKLGSHEDVAKKALAVVMQAVMGGN